MAEREGATDAVVDRALDSQDPAAALIVVLQALGLVGDPEPERAPEPEPEPEPEMTVADATPETPEVERVSHPHSLPDRIAVHQPAAAAAAPPPPAVPPRTQPSQMQRPDDRAVELAVARALAQLGIGATAPQPPPLFGLAPLEVEPAAASPAQLKQRLVVAQDTADATAVALQRGNAQLEARFATAERLEAAGDFDAALKLIATTRDVMNRTRSGLALEAALVAMDKREASVGLAKAKDEFGGAAGAAGLAAQLQVQQQRRV